MWSPLNIIALIVLVFVLIQKLCNQLVLTLVMMVVITFTMWSPLNIIDCLGFGGDPKVLQSIGVHIGDDGGVVYGDYIHNVLSPEHH